MNVRKHLFGDLVVGIALILFGIITAVVSLKMKIFKTFLDAPGLFPLMLGCLFVVLGLMLLVPSLRDGAVGEAKKSLGKQAILEFARDDKTIRTLILIAFMVIYIFVLIGRIPFTLASWLYLMATMLYLKSTKIWKIILISTLASVLISVAFRYGFRIPLP